MCTFKKDSLDLKFAVKIVLVDEGKHNGALRAV